jgi:hypothetical protein
MAKSRDKSVENLSVVFVSELRIVLKCPATFPVLAILLIELLYSRAIVVLIVNPLLMDHRLLANYLGESYATTTIAWVTVSTIPATTTPAVATTAIPTTVPAATVATALPAPGASGRVAAQLHASCLALCCTLFSVCYSWAYRHHHLPIRGSGH